jgi:uncharacterized UBP type Zn finger protein
MGFDPTTAKVALLQFKAV